MKTIEERAKEYASKKADISLSPVYNEALSSIYEEGYIAGAVQQKAIEEEVRLKKCDDITKAECDREVAFAGWYNKNGKGIPTYSDAIEWARRELIDEACDILSDLGVFDWMASDDPEGFSPEVHKDQFVKCLTEEN